MSNSAPPPGEPFQVEEPAGAPGPFTSENEKLLGGLAYVSQIFVPAVLPVVLLLSRETQNSRFLRYHAVQSIALLVASVVYYLAATVAYALLSAIAPFLGCILWLLFLVPTAAMGYYGYLAFRGAYAQVPWVTEFLRKNAWL
ncbi:MAG: hypothetical protein FJZ90_08970 [Chloroflexi bacterium]|nr:hypothetical protein [Chloroflexota bacterium]